MKIIWNATRVYGNGLLRHMRQHTAAASGKPLLLSKLLIVIQIHSNAMKQQLSRPLLESKV